jgi:hypothetical protein
MRMPFRPLLILIVILFLPWISENIFCSSPSMELKSGIQDTMLARQLLYNGRIWRNTTSNIEGDPYLLSREFLNGSVTISGRLFENNYLLYDIYSDEVLILSDKRSIINLNKELISRFTLDFNNQVYRFIRLKADSLSEVDGFVNELYGGRSSVYVKYRKMIQIKAVDNIYDAFYQIYRVYIVKDGLPHQVKNRKQLLYLFQDEKQKIQNYLRSNRIKLSEKRPESFVPVAEFYDSLKK